MGAINYFEAILGFDEVMEIGDMRAGGIAHEESGRKMDRLHSIALHFLHGIFNIATRTPVTGRKPNNFNLPILVSAECAFSLAQ